MVNIEEHWHKSFDAITDLVSLHDKDFRIVRVNKAFTETFHLTQSEIAGNHCYEIIHNTKELLQGCPCGDAMASKKTVIKEIYEPRLRLYLEVTAYPIFDGKDEFKGALHFAKNITERKRTENTLRANEQLLHTMIETEPECIKLLASDGTLLMMNRAGLRMIETDSLEQVKGKSVMHIVAPEHRKEFERLVEEVFRGKERTLEFEIIGLKGTHRWLDTNAVPLRDERGEIFALLGITRDITEHKRSDERLQEQLSFLQVLIDTIPNPIFYKDSDGIYLGCNTAFENSIGLSRDKIIGKTVYDLAPKELADVYHEMDRKLFRQPGIQTYESLVAFADGTKHNVIFNKATFMKKDGTPGGLVGIMLDITEHRKLEEQLRHAQKMEALGILAGGIAHDFNNILTAIIGRSGMILMRKDIDESLRAGVGDIEDSAVRAAELTKQLLAYSRKQVLEVRAVNLNDLIDNMAKLLRRIIGEDISLELCTGKTVKTTMADSGQIEQVIMNLVVNARDAMPAGGGITIKIDDAELDETYALNRPNVKPGTYVMFSVSDTGTGMSREVQERIFEPFFTTKELGRGTGLGLSTVYGIVKQHNGYIYVYSEQGKGTTFKVYLPAAVKDT